MKVNILLQNFAKQSLLPKRRQVDEQKLSLPVIYEKGHSNVPKTSLHKRKQRKQQKYVSQTTLSPQQQILHDQVRFALGYNSQKKTFMPQIRKNNKTVLNDNSSEQQSEPKSIQKKQKFNIRRVKSTPKQKNYLAYILDNRNSFIQNYFAQIQHNLRKK